MRSVPDTFVLCSCARGDIARHPRRIPLQRVVDDQNLLAIGIASTIDNDLEGSDITIGATTALDSALDAIDRLRVTASSHQRAFLVETMGRDCGYLALIAGITGGAECVVIPEAETTPAEVAAELRESHRRGKSHAIVPRGRCR
jgi:6-phosphofructokinase